MDLGFWLLSLVGEQVVAKHVNNNIQMIGPTYSYDEELLPKSILKNIIKGTNEQIQMLNTGPVYLTKEGMIPVAQNRPYRAGDKELLFLITSNMPKEYLLSIAKASNQANGVLIMRGLVNDSVEETIQFVQPLIDAGALVQINPIPSETFRHRSYRKAPLIVKTRINSKGEYGCEAEESGCTASVVVGGVIHPPFGRYDVAKTLEFMGDVK